MPSSTRGLSDVVWNFDYYINLTLFSNYWLGFSRFDIYIWKRLAFSAH